ncbi:MAG: DUF4232 domain-containing protein [Frankia sp.]
MRLQSVVTRGCAAALSLPVIVVLGACASSPGSSAGGSPAGTGSSPVIAPVSGGGSGGGSSAGSTATATTSAVRRCATADLTVALPATAAGSATQPTVDLTFTNRSSTPCHVYGYPGAELRSKTGLTYELPRSPLVAPTTVVLASGATAHARLTYLPGEGPGTSIFTPTHLVVIPPNERTSETLSWALGPIVRQDGATHPGTYISALAPGA